MTPGSMPDKPAPESPAAWIWPMRILLTMSGSSPSTPPG